MVSDLPQDMELQHTMTHLEELRRKSSGGAEFWFARKIQGVLGYAEWRNFEKVIDRARSSMKTNGVPPSHHIVEVNKMVGAGKGGRPNERDFFLSRAACYLIAMNGDPTKLEIAAAQAYFAVQTRAREIESTLTEDEKRLELREKVKKSFKAVSGAAKEAGVANSKQPIFHNARYEGLYGMSAKGMKTTKGIARADNPFDYMGALELSANDFQMNLATETLHTEDIQGEVKAILKNREVAKKVRKTMIESGSRPPEKLPISEPIKSVAKRLMSKTKTKILNGPTG